MQPGGAGRHDDAIQVVGEYILFDAVLTGFGTGVRDVFGHHHVFKLSGHVSHFFTVYGPCDIEAAVADIDSNTRTIFRFF
jgi:hypothetical protein